MTRGSTDRLYSTYEYRVRQRFAPGEHALYSNGGFTMSNTHDDRTRTSGGDGATYLLRGEARVNFPTDRMALLVIDPVNDFLSEGGAGWEMAKLTVTIIMSSTISSAQSKGAATRDSSAVWTDGLY